MISDQVRFDAAIARFDAANREDTNVELVDGIPHPKELLYAERMTVRLKQLDPEASEALQLAARCQHIRRWTIPRNAYTMDREGYRQWRSTLAQFHADTADAILQEAGYDETMIHRVQQLVRKEGLKRDPEVQRLEDVACLVFLEHYFIAFTTKHEEEKLIGILRKTWNKMSSCGHEAALRLSLPPDVQAIVNKALA